MKTYHWNGDEWYERDWSLLHHIRYWFIWFGGWERANGAGWQLRNKYNGKLMSPAPVSLFGRRFTWHGWGWNLRLKKGWLVYSYRHGKRALYISPNGTPNKAMSWWHGAPCDVIADAEKAKRATEEVMANTHRL